MDAFNFNTVRWDKAVKVSLRKRHVQESRVACPWQLLVKCWRMVTSHLKALSTGEACKLSVEDTFFQRWAHLSTKGHKEDCDATFSLAEAVWNGDIVSYFRQSHVAS